tara:strand:+ start:886 stop:1083 length:198 start_codon:yes stop_codon:yes gene_type:complete
MSNSEVINILTLEAKQHKRQARYHRRRAKTLLEQAEVLRTEFGIETKIIGKNTQGVTANVRTENR